jgi:hypothetical protein
MRIALNSSDLFCWYLSAKVQSGHGLQFTTNELQVNLFISREPGETVARTAPESNLGTELTCDTLLSHRVMVVHGRPTLPPNDIGCPHRSTPL